MNRIESSFARRVAVGGLIGQFVLTVAFLERTTTLDLWLDGLAHGAGDALGSLAALVLLAGLVLPVARGKPWALAVSILLQAGLVAGIVPYLIGSFAHPADFAVWLLNLAYVAVGVLAIGYGVVAWLEVRGRLRARGPRSVEGAIALIPVAMWLGMALVGGTMANAPNAGGILGAPADSVAVLTMNLMAFMPSRLPVSAGRRTAIVVVNDATQSHSFDVDSLGVHRRVPPRSTAVVLVAPTSPGNIPFYCGIPGHKEAGMVGVLVVR